MRSPLPLFPLNAVVVPGLVLPLHIFEPRYRALVEELLAIPDEDAREFGVIAVRDGRDVSRDGKDALFPVGTATVIRQAERLDDGRFDIVTTGSRRFRIIDVDLSAPLARAEVEYLDDPTAPADMVTAAQVALGFRDYRMALSGQVVADDDADFALHAETGLDDLPDDPTVLSYLVTAAMVLPMAERQHLLAAPSTGERLALARRLLHRETTLITVLSALPAIDLTGTRPSVN
ncbi:MAG: LON peptidase substrate-binding domain-containing protein [Actinobacteria bacterium]|nr:LON peptidase substrate-binding domain-containing protein [Actinomycetota bacterium]